MVLPWEEFEKNIRDHTKCFVVLMEIRFNANGLFLYFSFPPTNNICHGIIQDSKRTQLLSSFNNYRDTPEE